MFFDDWLQTSPDTLNATAQTYFARADAHDPQIRTQGQGASDLQRVWRGEAATGYQAVHGQMIQTAQGDRDAMRATAHTLMIIMNIVQILMTLMTIIKILQAAAILLAASSFFTAGATAPEAVAAEEGAAESFAAGQATNIGAKAMLRVVFNGLMAEVRRRAVGAGIGAVAGLGVGVYSDLQHHRSFGDSVLHTGEDMFLGATGGFEMSGWTPWTTGGVTYGFVQATAADLATGQFDLEGNFNTVMGDAALFTGVKDAWNLPAQARGLADQWGNATDMLSQVGQNTGRQYMLNFPQPPDSTALLNPDEIVVSNINDVRQPIISGSLRNPMTGERPGSIALFSGDGVNANVASGYRRFVQEFGLVQCAEGNGVQYLLVGDESGLLNDTLTGFQNAAQPGHITPPSIDPGDALSVFLRQRQGFAPCNLCQEDLQRLALLKLTRLNVLWDASPRGSTAPQIMQWIVDPWGVQSSLNLGRQAATAVNAGASGIVNDAQQFWDTFVSH